MFGGNQTLITGGTFTQVNNGESSEGFGILQKWVADGAFHNSSERFDPPKCHERTRVAVLNRISEWVSRQDQETRDAFIMWLNGPAGAGKSAIMQTIAETLDTSHRSVASFFFARNHPMRGNADRLIATIAYQLSLILPPEFRQCLVRALEHDPLVFSKTLDLQFTELIANPLEQLLMSGFSTNNPYVIIIDGLDECSNPQIQCKIIDLAFKIHQADHRLPLLFLIASRPELEISLSFELHYSSNVLSRLALDDGYLPDADIRLYLKDEMKKIKEAHPLRSSIPPGWPSKESIDVLVEKSSGQFIFAATAVKYVGSIRRKPADCLEKILGLKPLGKDTPFSELDSLYTHVISGVEDVETALLVLGAAILTPPQPSEQRDCITYHAFFNGTQHIESLLGMDPGTVEILFQDLKSLVSANTAKGTDGQNIDYISVLHASLGDFLFDKTRSRNLCVDPHQMHTLCANRCLEIAKDSLLPNHFDILCRLWYHFPLSKADLLNDSYVLNFDFRKLLSFVENIRGIPVSRARRYPRYTFSNIIGHYMIWLDLIPWSTPAIIQFKTYQFKAFKKYIISRLGIYFSDPELLLALLIRCGPPHIRNVLPIHDFDVRVSYRVVQLDNDNLFMNGTCRTVGPGFHPVAQAHKYLDEISAIINNPSSAGPYFLDQSKFTECAHFLLKRILKSSHSPPFTMSNHYMNICRNFPERWRRRKYCKDAYKSIQHSSRRQVFLINSAAQFVDVCDLELFKLQCVKDIIAGGGFRNALFCLPCLLDNSGASEDLINLVRMAKFSTTKSWRREYQYKSDVKELKQAMKRYLSRVDKAPMS